VEALKLITRPCTAGMHAACREPNTCGCPDCHLGPCAQCGATNLMKLYDGRCASCVRTEAHAAPKRTTSCDRCGAPGAFRNPATRKDEFLCAGCHQDDGDSLPLAVPVSALVAPCAGLDVADDRHVWVHLRGTRFQCRCGTKKFDAKLRDARRREELASFE
jgi:hypothetical protein